MTLSGKTAIVTGGGRATVERLRAAGANVATCGRGARPADLAEAVLWVQADVALGTDAERIVAATRAQFGPAGILVNNAGVQVEKPVTDTTDEDWDRVIGANCRGTFNMCRAFIPQAPEGGSIINLGSISGEVADPSMAIYNASKGFVHALTRSIAIDHGPGIRCNAVRPGWIMTEMAEAVLWLVSDASGFVTGQCFTIDGGLTSASPLQPGLF